MNELYMLRILIPNARTMELSELRDHVQSARHKAQARASLESKLFVPQRTHSVEDAAGALREFVSWRRRKQGMTNPWPTKRRAGVIQGPHTTGPIGIEG
jgi:hypothetical protein